MNKILFKVHSTLALAMCIPLLLICITGSILVFKYEIDHLLMAEVVTVTPADQRLPLDTVLNRVASSHPDYEAVGWLRHIDQTRADLLYLMAIGTSEWSYVYVNPYDATLLSQPELHGHYFTDWLLELHFNLLMEDAGMVATSVFGLGLLVLGISGVVLHRKFWKQFFTLRWNSRLVVYFSDLHKFVGVLSAPVLLILAFTGLWWNVASLLHEVQEHGGEHEPHVMTEKLYSDRLSLDALMAEAEHRIPDLQVTYITLPYEPGVDIAFWGNVPTGNIFTSEYASVVQFDPASGEHRTTFDIRKAGTGAVIVDSYRRLHFGDFAGLTSRVLWAILGFTPLLLAVTGVTIWWRRRPQRLRARNKSQLARI